MATLSAHPYPTSTGEQADGPPSGPDSAGAGDAGVLDRVVQTAHQTIDRLAGAAEPHVRQMQEGFSSAREMLQARAGEAREAGEEWTESLRTTVREHPIAAVATALALGVLVARLTAR